MIPVEPDLTPVLFYINLGELNSFIAFSLSRRRSCLAWKNPMATPPNGNGEGTGATLTLSTYQYDDESYPVNDTVVTGDVATNTKLNASSPSVSGELPGTPITEPPKPTSNESNNACVLIKSKRSTYDPPTIVETSCRRTAEDGAVFPLRYI
jgi:hypothetical protein